MGLRELKEANNIKKRLPVLLGCRGRGLTEIMWNVWGDQLRRAANDHLDRLAAFVKFGKPLA